MSASSSPKDYHISTPNIEVGVSWDVIDVNKSVDLDVSCVLYHKYSFVQDVVFYNHLKSQGVVHSGDCRTGEDEGDDELLKIDFKELDFNVECLVLALSCFSGGNFNQVGPIKIEIRSQKKTLQTFSLDKNVSKGDRKKTSLIFGAIYKKEGKWLLRKFSHFCMGKNWKEIEPDMTDILQFHYNPERKEDVKEMIDQMKRSVKRKEKIYQLEKGGIISLGNQQKIYLCLHWESKEKIDVDASIIGFSDKNEMDFCVYYEKKKCPYNCIIHHGDSLEGEIKSKTTDDNEIISLKLREMPLKITNLFFVLSVFHLEKTFMNLDRCWVRILNYDKKELFRYELKGLNDKKELKNGKIMFKIFRNKKYPLNFKFEPLNESISLKGDVNATEIGDIIKSSKEEYLTVPDLTEYEKMELSKLREELDKLETKAEGFVKTFLSKGFDSSRNILKDQEYLETKHLINKLSWISKLKEEEK